MPNDWAYTRRQTGAVGSGRWSSGPEKTLFENHARSLRLALVHRSLTVSRGPWRYSLALGLSLVGCVKPDTEAGSSSSEQGSSQPASGAPRPAQPPEKEPGAPRDARFVTGRQLLDEVRASGARATLVNAWASWCGPCRREFPMLVALKKQLAQRKVDVVFVSVDSPESVGEAVEFARQHGQKPPILVATAPLGDFKRTLHPGWPGMLPATFLFDAAGELEHFWGGPVYENELLPVIEDFLEGKDVKGSSVFPLTPGRDYRASPDSE